MIRRAFWLGIGAAAGIFCYRRVSALGRRLSGTVPGTTSRSAVRFARDVRDGMDLYKSDNTHDRKDGR